MRADLAEPRRCFLWSVVGNEVFESRDLDPATAELILDNGEVLLQIDLLAVKTFVPDRARLRASGIPLTVVIG